MGETAVDDPTFGKLVYDGYHHSGWATSFADPRFAGWGGELDRFYAHFSGDEPTPRTSAQDFATDLLAVAGLSSGADTDGLAEKMMVSARAFDAYNGSLDAEPLRKAGRFKLVVRNRRDVPPTEAQRAAWRAFRDGGEGFAERIAERLLAVYRRHRPELLRWWATIYRDSPDAFLPDVTSTRAMRSIVRPEEFRVYPDEDGGGVTVGILLGTLWTERSIDLRVREGEVVAVGPEPSGLEDPFTPKRIDAPPFGPMRWREGEGWFGAFHSDRLRGYHIASKERYRFATSPRAHDVVWRRKPPWDVITGDFELQVVDEDGNGPTAAQADAYRKFTADPAHTEWLVLAAILNWYQRLRPRWIAQINADPDEAAAVLPPIDSPEGLLEIIQLQNVCVWAAPDDDRPVAIGLMFAWEDEHGLGVRWRDGQIESVGDWESASDE